MRTIIIKQNVEFCYDKIEQDCQFFTTYYGGYKCLANGKACGAIERIKSRLWNNCPFKIKRNK